VLHEAAADAFAVGFRRRQGFDGWRDVRSDNVGLVARKRPAAMPAAICCGVLEIPHLNGVVVGRWHAIPVLCALDVVPELATGAVCSESYYSADCAYDDGQEDESGDEDDWKHACFHRV
jgi:hypothetical protein